MLQRNVKILCVDDEPNILKTLGRLFLDEDYTLLTATSSEEGLDLLKKEQSVQVVISDYRMPGMNGVDFLKKVCEGWPDTVRIVLSGYADTAAVVSAINEGKIYKFIPKPWNDDELKVTIAKAIDFYFLQKENVLLTEQLTASNEELQLLNESLEEAVQERTQELLFQNKVLQNSQLILDSLPFGVIGLDDKNIIVQCNRRSQEIIGPKGSTLLGSSVLDNLTGELSHYIEQAQRGKVRREKMSIRGEEICVEGHSFKTVQGQHGVIIVLFECFDD